MSVLLKPKVSVIIPVYKTQRTLKKCVESVLNQSLKNIEVILVDDGSPDNSGEMCDKYTTDTRVKVIHKKNGGLSSARNAGLDIASGEYIGFVDSDDYVEFTMYQEMVDFLEQSNSDVCICSHYTVDRNNQKHINSWGKSVVLSDKKQITDNLIFPLIGKDIKNRKPEIQGFVCRNLYKREIIADIRFKSERQYFTEDTLFNLEIYAKCNSVAILDKPFYYYVFNAQSLSNKYRPDMHKMFENLLEWEVNYLNKHGWYELAHQRLYATGLNLIIVSFKNIKRDGCGLSKKDSILLYKKILLQPLFYESIRYSKVMNYRGKMQAFLILCKFRCSKILYQLM